MDAWEIARIAHEVNRAYCASIGDMSQLPWDEAPEWQQESAYQGVAAIMEGRVSSPGDSHASWLEAKRSDGWIWGPVKNPKLKQHPCMVPFEELPPEQQVKDHLFVGTVRALLQTETMLAQAYVQITYGRGAIDTTCSIARQDVGVMAEAMRQVAESLEGGSETLEYLH